MKLSELKKYIEENIIEVLTVTPQSNAQDVTNGAKSKGINPADATAALVQANKTNKPVTLTGKVAEAKEEDEEVEDTYGKEDEDDKKDAKIKAAKPSKSELKKNASIATITDALAKVTIEFKEITEKYKKAEGGEKAKFLAKLKDLTPKIQTLKKALEKKEEALK
jgi:hypothetical protein